MGWDKSPSQSVSVKGKTTTTTTIQFKVIQNNYFSMHLDMHSSTDSDSTRSRVADFTFKNKQTTRK